MNVFSFLVGLALGLGVCLWQRYRLNQQLRQILTNLTEISDLQTSLPLLSLVRREIWQLQEQRQILLKNLHLQKSLLEQAPIGYLEVDGENQLLRCNQQARHFLNIDRWQSGQIRLLLELVRSYELDQLIENTRREQSPQVMEWTFYPMRHAWENSTTTALNYAQSLVLKALSYPLPQQAVGVFIENLQPLVDLSEARERAFSDLTHELRTPLTSILLVAETLEKRLQYPERRWIAQMTQEIQRMSKLIQDWLEISQLEQATHQMLSYQTLDIIAVLLGAWQKILPLAQQKSLHLDYLGPPELEIQGDNDRLLQVFLNLFDNAVKYSPTGEIICLEVHPRGNQVEINVVDKGTGFANQDLAHVFERLYRGDPSRWRDRSSVESALRGSGLGLAIAKQIIDAHRGSIMAQNHPQTQGAWIQVVLPLKVSG
jgi:two-component system phosphate regulon sensor histidine kinase PhoR